MRCSHGWSYRLHLHWPAMSSSLRDSSWASSSQQCHPSCRPYPPPMVPAAVPLAVFPACKPALALNFSASAPDLTFSSLTCSPALALLLQIKDHPKRDGLLAAPKHLETLPPVSDALCIGRPEVVDHGLQIIGLFVAAADFAGPHAPCHLVVSVAGEEECINGTLVTRRLERRSVRTLPGRAFDILCYITLALGALSALLLLAFAN